VLKIDYFFRLHHQSVLTNLHSFCACVLSCQTVRIFKPTYTDLEGPLSSSILSGDFRILWKTN